MRGDVRGFSQDRITRLLTRLDMDVDIQVRPKKQARATVRVQELVDRFTKPLANAVPAYNAHAWAYTRKASKTRASTAVPRKRTTTKRTKRTKK